MGLESSKKLGGRFHADTVSERSQEVTPVSVTTTFAPAARATSAMCAS